MTALDPSTGELVVYDPTSPPIPLAPERLKAQVEQVKELMRAVLVEGTDYGTVGNVKRPALFKSGAETLLQWARLGHRLEPIEVDRDGDGRKYGVTYRCTVFELSDPDRVRATCDGYCGYDEPDREAHTTDYGKRIPRSPWNTVVKMAQKRALVGATLQATATSGLFTQDVEDGPAHRGEATGTVDWWTEVGWESADAERVAHVTLIERLRTLDAGVQEAFKTWRTEAGIDLAKRLSVLDVDKANGWIDEHAVTDAEVVPDPQPETPAAPDDPPEDCLYCHEVIDPDAEGDRSLVFTADGNAAHSQCRDKNEEPF